MSTYKKQHYVPVSYLSAWSPDGRRIHMFDMETGLSRLVGMKSVAQASYFNDAFRRQQGKITDGLPANAVEREFQDWEGALLAMRKVALEVAANTRSGTLEERQTMSIAAAVQLLRTAKFRELILWKAARPRTGLPDDLVKWLPQPVQDRINEDPTFIAENISFIQQALLWTSGIVPHIATELYHYIWVIGKNENPFPFYTSDAAIGSLIHPVKEPPYFPEPTSYADGEDNQDIVKRLFVTEPSEGGLQLVFPLAPECALLMFHPRDFLKELGTRQGKVLVLGGKSVLIQNSAIAAFAARQVLSSTSDFWLAEAVRDHLESTRG